jgi:CxxC motif-containing protein
MDILEKEIICIGCPLGCHVKLSINEKGEVESFSNNKCKEGKKYAEAEFKSPLRVLCATLLTEGSLHPLLPVKTNKPIPKDKLRESMYTLSKIRVKPPIRIAQVILSNVLGTGADIVASQELFN